jgi:NDP-sugar pyrophosphorylase family protein
MELIMDSFAKEGFESFLLSVNYKKEFIKTYIAERRDLTYDIRCVEEETFLGTAGSLKLMEKDLFEAFFVSNCDILVDMSYQSALENHCEQGNAITIIGALKKVSVPYGVIRMGEGGGFAGIDEKPDLPLIINTGVYILEPHTLSLISEKERIDMTDLIGRVHASGGKIGVFPVHRRWIDIGQWGEYKNILD